MLTLMRSVFSNNGRENTCRKCARNSRECMSCYTTEQSGCEVHTSSSSFAPSDLYDGALRASVM